MKSSLRDYSLEKKFTSEYERLRIDYCDKCTLNLQIDLWEPFHMDKSDVTVDIVCYCGDSVVHKLDNISLHRPYPNSSILNSSIRFGRRLTKTFIPIVFDNLNALRRIDRIVIHWHIDSRIINEYCVIDYRTTFADPVQNGYYAFRSYDVPICLDLLSKLGMGCDISNMTATETEQNMEIFDHATDEYNSAYIIALTTDLNKDSSEINLFFRVHDADPRFMDNEQLTKNPEIVQIMLQETLRAQKLDNQKSSCYIDYYLQDIEVADNSYVI